MRRLGGVMAALAVLMATAVACSGGGSEGAAGRATSSTEPPVPIAFTIASFDVEAAADPVAGAVDGARAGVEATFRRWLDEDVVAPLRSGQPAPDLRPIFTPGAGEHVSTTADRGAFVSEGLPPVSGLTAETALLDVSGLADLDGQIPVVNVYVQLKLQGKAQGTPVTVEHIGDISLVPDGDQWKIDSYDVRATRDTAGTVTTTKAAS